jgi:ankyrin repeat protein
MNGQIETMANLVVLEKGKIYADVTGQTALHLAAKQRNVRAFIYLIDAGWDPYQLDYTRHSPAYYGLMNPHLATYIYATAMDLTHLAPGPEASFVLSLWMSESVAGRFYRRLPLPARKLYVNSQNDSNLTPLMGRASRGTVKDIYVRYRAGAELEICSPTQGTALTVACRVGQLSSVKYLVRLGAKMECSINGHTVNALDAAKDNHDVIRWFLVDQYLDQPKITNTPFNGEDGTRLRFWSGIRTVEIPLQGFHQRPMEMSLIDSARHYHKLVKKYNGWRFLVPLDWDTVAHFVPLPSELRK